MKALHCEVTRFGLNSNSWPKSVHPTTIGDGSDTHNMKGLQAN